MWGQLTQLCGAPTWPETEASCRHPEPTGQPWEWPIWEWMHQRVSLPMTEPRPAPGRQHHERPQARTTPLRCSQVILDPQKLREMVNAYCCFKLISFGVICYIAIVNVYNTDPFGYFLSLCFFLNSGFFLLMTVSFKTSWIIKWFIS